MTMIVEQCLGSHPCDRRNLRPNTRLRSPGGFTLVELLVVIAIIGTLIGLLLPAVQSARESARRSGCQNKLKQLGLGMLNHLDAKKTFPPRGVWGIETGSPPFTENHHTWITLILPYIEEQGLASGIDLKQPAWGKPHVKASLPVARCPSDPFFLQPSETNDLTLPTYAGCEGIDWWVNRYEATLPLGVVCNAQVTGVLGQSLTARAPYGEPHTLKTAKITDGLSKTLLLGEVTSVGFFNGNPRGLDRMGDGVPAMPSRAYARAAFIDVTVDGSIAQAPWKKANGNAPGAWIYIEPGPGNTGPPGMSGPVFMTRGGINSDYLGAHSFHLGFIDVAMCDGSVRPVRETTDWRIWNLICSADDTQVIND
jgi:prepilin-type N-terminal cleavage/methylation domain-containing protein